MEQIYSHLAARKKSIEMEFSKLGIKSHSLTVTPHLPDFLDLTVKAGSLHTKSKTIHFMEKTHLREMLRFHGVV
jgi:hypothetical protein